jgi:hypothetical protein
MSHALADEAGALCLTLAPFATSDRERAVQLRWVGDTPSLPSPAAWRDALDAVVADAAGAGMRLLETRVVHRDSGRDEALTAARASSARAALTARGFAPDGGRAEFRLPLDGDATVERIEALRAGDPFTWDALSPAGAVTFERAARAMHEASHGDPMSSPDEDAAAALREALMEESLTHDPAGVQVGALDGADAAFVMAQVNPATGWSRVTYMGVLPACRGRRLGAFVHARGLALARAQGGRVYVGGTSVANAPMLALFRALGAEPFRAMERWTLTLDGRGAPSGAPSRP